MTEPNGLNVKTQVVIDDLTSIQSRLVDMDSNLGNIHSAIGTTNTVLTDLSGTLNIAIGTFGEAEPGTILYLLRTMASCICALAEGVPPNPADPEGCEAPLADDGVVLSADYSGLLFVTWQLDLPSGVVHDDFTDHSVPGAGIHITATSGVKIYVQSARAAFFSDDPDSPTAYPTNVWVPFSEGALISINVPAGSDAKAFLCVAEGFFDCVTRPDTGTASVHATVDDSDRARLYTTIDGLGFALADTIVSGGETFTWDVPDAVAAGDGQGIIVTMTEGPLSRVWWKQTGAGFDSHYLSAVDTPFVIPVETDYWGIDNWVDPVGNTANHYTVEICPPGE